MDVYIYIYIYTYIYIYPHIHTCIHVYKEMNMATYMIHMLSVSKTTPPPLYATTKHARIAQQML